MIPSLTAHLWQSTLYVVAVAALTLLFRKNRAQVRFWLWLSASVNFAVPFVLLMKLGGAVGLFAPATSRKVATGAVYFALGQFNGPSFATRVTPVGAIRIDWIPVVLLTLWLVGFLAIVAIRFRGWLRIRSGLRSSRGIVEPGVVGFLRPVLVLPDGITERLSEAELRAIVAHEVCHIERRDSLLAAIHMIVEAMFWFHPFVWWIGARLVEERERACDEEVLLQGHRPDVYADAILSVCKLYMASPLVCAAGVSGADIKRRIEAIMRNRVAARLGVGQKAVLVAAATFAVATSVVVGVLTAPAARAQSVPGTRAKFEVASIRRCIGEDIPTGKGRGGGGNAVGDADLFRSRCSPVAGLIRMAYIWYADSKSLSQDQLKNQPLQGGPAWIDTDRYTVEAKPASSQTTAMMSGPMLRTLLEDRFRLKVHRASKEIPVYALVTSKGGSGLHPTKEGGCTPGDGDGRPVPVVAGQPLPCGYMSGEKGYLESVGVPITSIATVLASQVHRSVIDNTGLTGLFDYHLDIEIGPPNSAPALDDPAFSDTMATVTSALQKLGLKLEPAKRTAEFIVIDHIERPSEN